MILYEHEGKKLFQQYAIPTPRGVVAKSADDPVLASWETFPCIVKAQVLAGKRGMFGGVKRASSLNELQVQAAELFSKKVCNDQVAGLLVEEAITFESEWYLAVTYSTRHRRPVLLFSFFGGSNVEDGEEAAECIFDPLRGFEEHRVRDFFLRHSLRGKDLLSLTSLARSLFTLFWEEDARLAEINPLVKRSDTAEYIALDAKVMMDDDALYRHDRIWDERTILGRWPTEREHAVCTIDTGEFYYRGTAGKYIEMDGDIACLFSGGGASISMMDALAAAGGKPANYTEYSGNPPRQKVYELAKIVLSKPGLRGIWIVGGVANFTHIGETMAGIADALRDLRPAVPIVIRRAGPYEHEGRRMMEDIARECEIDLCWYGRDVSMTDTARILMDKICLNQKRI